MKKVFLALMAVIIGLVAVITLQGVRAKSLRQELQRETANAHAMLQSIRYYETADSLNVANIGTLLLTLDEYKRYRADDMALIKTLQTKGRDIASVEKVTTCTTGEIKTIVRDSLIVRDNYIVDTLNCIDIEDDYFVMHGCIDGDKFDGVYAAYDSLITVETIKYKRFLGCLWKTKRIKDRRLEVFSKNPNTFIQDVEHIIIYK